MRQGCLTVLRSTVGGAVGGVLLGVLIGAIARDYLLWIALSGASGAAFGLMMAYGFLPEN